MIRRMITAACALGLAAAPTAFAGMEAREPSYFISIDGLNPPLLKTMQEQGKLPARKGFKWLLDSSRVYDKAWPVVTTLTAASHVSTITCTPPSRHGVVANGYIKDGKKVSGFSEPFATEAFWKSAARQGKKVISLAYAGADGDIPERSADYGLAYPSDKLLAPHLSLEWTIADLADASGWVLGDFTGKDEARFLKEVDVTLVLNPLTSESRLIHALIDVTDPSEPKYVFDMDKDLTNGVLGRLSGKDGDRPILNLFFVEESEASTVKGFKRRSFARTLPADQGKLALYFSKASYNAAYPASLRQRLDDLNLVWPDYGVRSSKLTGSEWVDTQSLIDTFLTDVAVRVVPELDVDIVLYYNPLLDSIGHKHQAALPLPFDPANTDEITQIYVKGFQVVDNNLSRLFARANRRTAIALMGDHGMDPVKKVVNTAKLLPADHIGKLEIVASGSLTMLYMPLEGTDGDSPARVAQNAAYLKEKLEALTFEGMPVFDKMLSKADFKAASQGDYNEEWQYGDALFAVSTKSGFWLQYQPLNQDLFIDPPALGMHGNFLGTETMPTNLIVHGRGIRAAHYPETSLIHAVPTFSAMLGIDAPKDCLGRSLLNDTAK